MPKPFFIIDGYNLMHAWGLARQRYGPGDLQRLRGQFLNELAARMTEKERRRTTIVFDAGREAPTDVSPEQYHQQMRIVYALQDEDADSRIEKLIAGHSAPKQIRVVSSDRRLQVAVRRRRGRFVSSEEFAAERKQAASQQASPQISGDLKAKLTGEISESEMDEWLEIFGDSGDD